MVKKRSEVLELIGLLFVTIFVVSFAFSNDSPFFWGAASFLILIFFNKLYTYENKIFFDKATIATIVLTIVLLSISIPISKPRVEIINIGEPYSLSITDSGGRAFRIFDFQVTKPLLPLIDLKKGVYIGNRIYSLYKKDYQNYGTVHYVITHKEPNKLIQNNGNAFLYDKEYISLKIETDFPINVEEIGNNISNFYQVDQISSVLCSSSIYLINFQNSSINYNKNLTIFIPFNTSIHIFNSSLSKPFTKTIGDYRKGFFIIKKSNDCTYNTSIPVSFFEKDNSRINSSQGLSVTFQTQNDLTIGNNIYSLYYLPSGIRAEYSNITTLKN